MDIFIPIFKIIFHNIFWCIITVTIFFSVRFFQARIFLQFLFNFLA